MPVYEYVCDRCETKFEALRTVSRMDEPAPCPKGHGSSHRVMSRFAALTKDDYDAAEPVGDGGCGGCADGGGCGGCAGGCACGAN